MDPGLPKKVWYRTFDMGEILIDLHVEGVRRYVHEHFDNDNDGVIFWAHPSGVWIEERISIDPFDQNRNVETTYTQMDPSHVGWELFNNPRFFYYERYDDTEQPRRVLPPDLENYRGAYEKRLAAKIAANKPLTKEERDFEIGRLHKAKTQNKDILLKLRRRCPGLTIDVIKGVIRRKFQENSQPDPNPLKPVATGTDRVIADLNGVAPGRLRLQSGSDDQVERVG